MFETTIPLESLVRSRDPESSWQAAESISREGWTALMGRVYDIVAYANVPLTRDQIFALYDDTRNNHSLPRVTPQRVRGVIKALLLGERADFHRVRKHARALVVVDMEGVSDAGHRAERIEVVTPDREERFTVDEHTVAVVDKREGRVALFVTLETAQSASADMNLHPEHMRRFTWRAPLGEES